MILCCGCSDHRPGATTPLVPRARQDSEMIDISSTVATVRGADSARPTCPIYPHVEATMVFQGVTGTVQYRWERSDGTAGPLTQLVVGPAPAGRNGSAALSPDDWKDDQHGVQLTIDEYVHVTYPFEFRSAPVTLNAKCF